MVGEYHGPPAMVNLPGLNLVDSASPEIYRENA